MEFHFQPNFNYINCNSNVIPSPIQFSFPYFNPNTEFGWNNVPYVNSIITYNVPNIIYPNISQNSYWNNKNIVSNSTAPNLANNNSVPGSNLTNDHVQNCAPINEKISDSIYSNETHARNQQSLNFVPSKVEVQIEIEIFVNQLNDNLDNNQAQSKCEVYFPKNDENYVSIDYQANDNYDRGVTAMKNFGMTYESGVENSKTFIFFKKNLIHNLLISLGGVIIQFSFSNYKLKLIVVIKILKKNTNVELQKEKEKGGNNSFDFSFFFYGLFD